MAKKDKPEEPTPEPTPPERPEPLTNVYATLSAVKIKDGEMPVLQFTVSVPLGPDMENMHRAAEIMVQGGGFVTVVPRPFTPPAPNPQMELPLDGPVVNDPFPAWEKLFDAVEMPACACPPEASEAGTMFPNAVWTTNDDGTKVEIQHMEPCALETKTISTLDFNDTEDFNRAIVKARGLKPTEIEFDNTVVDTDEPQDPE